MTQFLAGAARSSISPSSHHLVTGIWLGGFGAFRQRRATGVLDDPECRALAITDGEAGFVLVALDLVGASDRLLAAIRSGGAAATQLAPGHILVSCTHSHGSPDTQGLWGGVPPEYEDFLVDRAVAAIAHAWQAKQHALLRAASVPFDGLVRNRRDWPATDTMLTALRVLAADASPIATLVNFACHPTALGGESTLVSRDWCGVTADILDREAGGVTLVVNGALGDAVPLLAGAETHARTLGQGVAGWALDAIRAAEETAGGMTLRHERVTFPLQLARLESGLSKALEAAGLPTDTATAAVDDVFEAGHAGLAQMLAAVRNMGRHAVLSADGSAAIHTTCTYISIGDVEVITAPGEMTTRLALPVRSQMLAPHRMILGLTHDTLGYFIPRDEYMTGRNNNYEESVSLGYQAGATLADVQRSLIGAG